MKYLVKVCFIVISAIVSFGSVAAPQPPECSVLPRDANGRLTNGWLIRVVAADIHNIGTAEPEASHYMKRLEPLLKATMNMDCITDDYALPAANAVLDGFDQAFAGQPDWSKSLRNVSIFKEKSQNSPIAMALEVQYWIQYAWNARGTGFSSSVAEEGWKLFKERLLNAEKLLIDNKAKASAVPLWYTQMIVVQTALGRPKKARDEVFVEGARRYKKYYGLYKSMRSFLDPRWGGSFEAVDNLIKWSVNNTRDIMGDRMYATLYAGLRYNMLPDQSFFKDTLVDWERFRKAQFAEIKSYPLAYEMQNQFAAIACEKGDKNTYLIVRKKIGKNIASELWGGKTSLELCDAKFGLNH